MEQGILLGVLGLGAAEDIRKRRIKVPFLLLSGAVGISLHIYRRDLAAADLLLGVLVGVLVVFLGILTRESIGLGDGFSLMVTGIFLGGRRNVELLFLSLFYAALFSLGLLLFCRKRRKQRIPFLPFLFLGYLTMVLEEII